MEALVALENWSAVENMAFLLVVWVNFGRRSRFVRRNKPDFTSFQSAVKYFFVRHSKNNSGRP
jgi:steroid 5-alpha reductase family enzyme